MKNNPPILANCIHNSVFSAICIARCIRILTYIYLYTQFSQPCSSVSMIIFLGNSYYFVNCCNIIILIYPMILFLVFCFFPQVLPTCLHYLRSHSESQLPFRFYNYLGYQLQILCFLSPAHMVKFDCMSFYYFNINHVICMSV